MVREVFEDWNPSPARLEIVRLVNDICEEYARQGYDLTLRQVYYQLVARGYVPNTERSYKNTGDTLNRARLAGLLDWRYIEDRTRNLAGYGTTNTVQSVIESSRWGYTVSHWDDQDYRVEVWVEKEALVGVVQRAAGERRMDHFACRGYVSQSELYRAAKRHRRHERAGKQVVVLHLGDHDPSGVDMTRDIEARLALFGADTIVERIALNMDQIEEYAPPPNPAKITDSRAKGYIAQHGRSSWELDALEPSVIHDLILERADEYIDFSIMRQSLADEAEGRAEIEKVARHWEDVRELMETFDD